jgi:hypothetical protein
MNAHPIPIYLGCAGLIVGSLGLGSQYVLGTTSAPETSHQERPLFARSVEEAALPARNWHSSGREVAHYDSTLEILKPPAPSAEPAPGMAALQESRPDAPREVRQIPIESSLSDIESSLSDIIREPARSSGGEPSPAVTVTPPPAAIQPMPEPPRAAARAPGRDVSTERSKQSSKRTKNAKNKDVEKSRTARSTPRNDVAEIDEPDPRDARAEYDPRDSRAERRPAGEDLSGREGWQRVHSQPERRAERRRGEPLPREVVREVIRETEVPRSRSEPRQQFGFTPFHVFGGFD